MVIIINFFIITLFLKEITGRLCNDGWIYFQPTKYCYLLIEKPATFNKAQFVCLVKAANLVSIHNEAENRFVSEMIAKIGEPIWLGAAIFDSSKMHENVDSSPFDYNNWQNGSNFNQTQAVYKKGRPCVKINSENRKWFSDCCYKKPVPYMCKKSAEKEGRSYLNRTINITSNIIPKFSNKRANITRLNKSNDTVLSFVTIAYGSKNNSNKVISA